MDRTGAVRQQRRIDRMKEGGVTQSSVLVHDLCREALNGLRPHLSHPESAPRLNDLVAVLASETPVNVAQVKQLSPFRYPGGKTWLVPHTRQWLRQMPEKPAVLLEPFAGGAMVGLSAAAEGLAERVELWELDDDVAAVWKVVFGRSDADVKWLSDEILDFEMTLENVRVIIDAKPRSTRRKAFRTIVKNRVQRGGIMANGAGLVKAGENGHGLNSRWYPATLAKRLTALRALKDNVTFTHGNAFDALNTHAVNPACAMFIDPPYTAAGKRAGSRLYTHNDLDHERLFKEVSAAAGTALLTYDDTPEMRALAANHGFLVGDVAMKSTHHAVMRELTIFKS